MPPPTVFHLLLVCKNAAMTIERTLVSIVAQTETDFELIVVEELRLTKRSISSLAIRRIAAGSE